MQIALMLAGAILGVWLGAGYDAQFPGIVLGAVVGWLVSAVASLRREQGILETRLERLIESTGTPPGRADAPEPLAPAEPRMPQASPPTDVRPESVRTPGWAPAAATSAPSATATLATAPPSRSFDTVTIWLRRLRQWFTTGNVPVKLGVVITFFGVAFLLKYAVDEQLVTLPIELRLAGVALGAIALLVAGWRLRERLPAYALSLQGGGIGILYLTIFAAFRLYDLLPSLPAFALLVALTFGAGALAHLQNSLALAVLATIGGFLAPLLVSTGSGNHVALFSYYLVINSAILGLAWFRRWRVLNLIGFAFTFGIGALWGLDSFPSLPDKLLSTVPFLAAFFLMYHAIGMLFALRQPPRLRGFVDGTLTFGLPVIAFGMLAALMRDTEFGLALSAVALAFVYAASARWLMQRYGAELRVLIDAYLALAVAFGTVAIPLALDAEWTTAAWALEGAALVWIGTRQSRRLAMAAGSALILLAGLTFGETAFRSNRGALPIANGDFLGGVLIGAAGVFSAYRLDRLADPSRWQRWLVPALAAWGALWWLGAGFNEIENQLPDRWQLAAVAAFVAGSGWLAVTIARRLDWRFASAATFAYLPLLGFIGLISLFVEGHFLTPAGIVGWPLAWAVQGLILHRLENKSFRLTPAWHSVTAVALTIFVALEVGWLLDYAGMRSVWSGAVAATVFGLAALALVSPAAERRWPVASHLGAYRIAAAVLVGIGIAVVTLMSLNRGGDPAPLPWLPVANPYDLATLITLLSAWRIWQVWRATPSLSELAHSPAACGALGVAAFGMTTLAVIRGVHHVTGIPWIAGTLVSSDAVQGALSVYWGLVGAATMAFGARRASRVVWFTGAVIMALVLAKLLFVDLSNSATVARVVAFLVVGPLLLLIGYFAPTPPKNAVADKPATEGTRS